MVIAKNIQCGRVVKLVDTLVLGTSAVWRGGSSPLSPTVDSFTAVNKKPYDIS